MRVRLLPFSDKIGAEAEVESRTGSPKRKEREETNGEGEAEGEEWADTQTYIWIAPEHELEEQEWDFDEFVRTKMWRWSGASEEFKEVDALGDDQAQGQGQVHDPTRGRQYFDGQKEDELVRAAV